MANAIFLRKRSGNRVKLALKLFFCAALPVFAALSGKTAIADAAGEPRVGTYSKLPLPRFASVKADPARLRRGPGVDYPILWELTRRGLPVRIIGEYRHWRRVELHDGSRGWMHRVLLSGRRTALLLGAKREIRAEPISDAVPVATVEDATPLRLGECRADWCALEAQGVDGWAPRARLWGADPATAAQSASKR